MKKVRNISETKKDLLNFNQKIKLDKYSAEELKQRMKEANSKIL